MCRILNILIVFISFIFSERGDLISYEYKDQKLKENIQTDLENSDAGQLGPNAIYNIKSYSIIYETIDQFDQSVQASGSIVIPDNIDFAYPFYLFGHGTEIKRENAPSLRGFNDLNMWVTSSGYIFIEPDYLGIGISEIMHPYHLKDVTASSMIDMIYAVKQFCNQMDNIQFNDQLFIAGYSEGGYAAMATVKEIEENYLDINITMSFPMAGAYDLSGTMVDLMLSDSTYEDPFYLPFFVLSYIEKYNLGSLEMFFKNEYAEILPELFNGEYSGGYINGFLPEIPMEMLSPEVIQSFEQNPDFEFKLRLQENNLTNWTPYNPMYLFHGIADERVPYQNSVVAYETLGGTNNQNLYFETLDESYGGHQDAAPWCLITAFNISEEVKLIYEKGDLDFNGLLDVIDVVSIVNSILINNNQENIDFWISNLNHDEYINIFDIILLIEKILLDD